MVDYPRKKRSLDEIWTLPFDFQVIEQKYAAHFGRRAVRGAIRDQCLDRGQQGRCRGVEDENKQICPGSRRGNFQRDGEGGRGGEHLYLHDQRGANVKDSP